MKTLLAGTLAFLALFIVQTSAQAQSLEGSVSVGHAPLPDANVTLWQTNGLNGPEQLNVTTTKADGSFSFKQFDAISAQGSFYLLVTAQENKNLLLLSVLGTEFPEKAVVNELTTVASVFTHAQFLKDHKLVGTPLGLSIAARNTPNLVDPATGTWGDALLDPLNSTQSTTLAKLNTMASLLTAYALSKDLDWTGTYQDQVDATPADKTAARTTLDVAVTLARAPWQNAEQTFKLFETAYPMKEGLLRRPAPFQPYLQYAPDDFALVLRFAGGGTYAPGRLAIDAQGNVWSGQNWMPGSQSSVVHNIGGGLTKLAPDGTALSPPITGFTGQRVDGVGWGTGVDQTGIWVAALNSTISKFDFDGNLIGTEKDADLTGQLGELMGVATAPNGDVWIADGSKDQLVHFPGGDTKQGKLVQVEGLKSPFGIAVDAENRVWVSNSQSNTVLRFPADDPNAVESYSVGTGVRGVALDSSGNLWVASLLDVGAEPPAIPAGTPIMKQFELLAKSMEKQLVGGESSGVVSLISPSGEQVHPKGFNGDGKINVPWGVSVDGHDDVWLGNFGGRGVALLAGVKRSDEMLDVDPGDVVHIFQSGSIQMVTDVAIDPAGNVWLANNWNDAEVVVSDDPSRPSSTWAGGTGIAVIYGAAKPVETPVMGPVNVPVQ
ncbi:hypothetical protein PUV47_13360 [Pseudovibrio exalbescens]|uniref:hypothetical protein n=1 Tax=Pseudovibrio exalbescens TaxID=197461 RepID=UPI0023671E56|nr:hypothetical protein [Pseudovibrio exalbescens]MDD7910910.1 hypothetical protein [Pseudovibrio exalbescens]